MYLLVNHGSYKNYQIRKAETLFFFIKTYCLLDDLKNSSFLLQFLFVYSSLVVSKIFASKFADNFYVFN